MKLPLQISWKNMARSKAVTNIVREKAEKLDRLCPQVISCRVILSMPHKSHQKGNHFHITINVSLPGKEVIVSHEPQNEIENVDFYHVLKVAFEAAFRQVEEYHRLRHVA